MTDPDPNAESARTDADAAPEDIHGWDAELFSDEEHANTPERIAGFREEWRENREYDKFTTFENPGYDQMVTLTDIDFHSMCSHHLLPFHGIAHIAYLPDEEVLGISKLARAVDKFASKPQTQEQLTHDVAAFLMDVADPKGVMVVLEGQHQCMTVRGVQKQNTTMQTSDVRGWFKNPPDDPGVNPREEFLALLQTDTEAP